MKKIKSIAAVIILIALIAFSSCGSPKSTFENFFISVKKFDIEKAKTYVDESSGDYLDSLLGYISSFTEDQKKTAERIFSLFDYEYSDSGDGSDGGVFVKITYVDFNSLIRTVNEEMAVGTESASYYINELLDSGKFGARYIKESDAFHVIITDGKALPFGYSGENAKLTQYMGLDVFLRWYSGQR